MVTLEPSFDFLFYDNKISLVILTRNEKIQQPFFVFDNHYIAALFRNKYEIIQLMNIPKFILKKLQNIKNIYVIEMTTKSEIVCDYKVDVIIDKKLNKKLAKESWF